MAWETASATFYFLLFVLCSLRKFTAFKKLWANNRLSFFRSSSFLLVVERNSVLVTVIGCYKDCYSQQEKEIWANSAKHSTVFSRSVYEDVCCIDYPASAPPASQTRLILHLSLYLNEVWNDLKSDLHHHAMWHLLLSHSYGAHWSILIVFPNIVLCGAIVDDKAQTWQTPKRSLILILFVE